MPPALLRTRLPIAPQKIASTVRYSTVPITARSACGEPSVTLTWCSVRIAWEAKKAIDRF